MAAENDVLRRILTERFTHQATGRRTYVPTRAGTETVTAIHRMHLILSGTLTYRIHGEPEPFHLKAGTQTFITAWVRRRWEIIGPEPCELLFYAFGTADFMAHAPRLYHRQLSPADFQVERDLFARLHSRHEDYIEAADELWAEGEVKASIARFFHGHQPLDSAQAQHGDAISHPTVQRAEHYLIKHFANPDAIRSVSDEVRLTPNYLRRLFLQHTGQTIGQYVLRVRMQRARYMLQTTSQSVKEIAALVGFQDALHFSRRYAEFWKLPPSKDRQTVFGA